MLIMPTHVTEVEINPPNFSQKHFFLKAAKFKLGKLKMKQGYTSQKQSNVVYLIVKIMVKK